MVLVCGRALAAAFLPQKSLGASFHSSCSKIIDSNVVSLGNLPGSCAQGPPGSEATEGCSQPHGSVQICRFQAKPHAQEWQGGIFSTLPKWDPSPNPSPPSLPWLQPPLNRQQSCPMQPGQGRFSSRTAAAPAQWHSSALPWLTETHGAAASINGALCSLRSQMPSPSSPHAERVLCVHNQPLGSSEPGNKTPSLSPGRAWCPPSQGAGWGQQVRGGV